MGSLKKALFLLAALLLLSTEVSSETHVLYNTKAATSDLEWALHPAYGAWEELSSLYLDGSTIRSYQVCNTDMPNQDNWARSPFIDAKSAQRVYIDIEFSVMKCSECRETFSIYYYPSDSNVASSTFPPWMEEPYIKVDTVAAGERFDDSNSGPGGVNKKTLEIGPLKRRGFYIAIQDQGACMSIMSMKLYFHYCPETTHNLAYFPKTVAGGEVASLVPVDGKCVSNAVYVNNIVPMYRCNSNGEWTVPTGSCQCRAGHQPNREATACQACPAGFYKSVSGNHACTRCPHHSVGPSPGKTMCKCRYGYFRAESDSIEVPCTQPPSAPNNVTYVMQKSSVTLRWTAPIRDGGRDDLYYSVKCQQCEASPRRCHPCPPTVDFNPPRPHRLTQTDVTISDLDHFSYYVITVNAHNGVSKVSGSAPASQAIEFSTNEAVPSAVRALRLVGRGKNSLTVMWEKPSRDNGLILDYEVQATPITTAGTLTPIITQVSTLNVTIGGLESGSAYEIRVKARTSAGYGQFSHPITFSTLQEEEPTDAIDDESTGIIIAAVAGAVILLVVVVVVMVLRRRRSKRALERERLMRNKLADGNTSELVVRDGFAQARNARKTYVDYRDPHKGVKEIAREIDVSKIKIERVIGRGEFGEVCKGKLMESKSPLPVAVKRLKHGASLIDQTNFLREACTMAQFEDRNIVQLQGVVTKSVPAMILTEFMENGSLDRLLQRKRGDLSILQLIQMLKGIASGMRYLSSMKYVHRDLAARNILVNSELVCKVSDFGLSRTLENDPHATYTTQGGKIALRWTAPECIRYRQFTSASDVWSYGIVMWEVMSYGEKPYWDMSNDDVTEVIEDGYRLPAPLDCPQVLHNLMLNCWSYDPRRRPTFTEILSQLDALLHKPALLEDQEPATDQSAPLLNPDSPSNLQDVNTLDEWLDMVKLGRYRHSFHARGINDLESLAHISPSDLERLGIASPSHLSRLQGGLDTLRRHLGTSSPPNPPSDVMSSRNSNTMRPSSDLSPDPSLTQTFTLPSRRADASVAIV